MRAGMGRQDPGRRDDEFTDRPYRGASEQLRMVERFTPVAPDSGGVVRHVQRSDHTWTRPWTFAMNSDAGRHQQVFEYACHEGNYGLSNILSAARAEEK